MPVLRDFQKIKSMDDFRKTDPPILVDGISQPTLPPLHSQMILRMLVRPKYGDFRNHLKDYSNGDYNALP